MYELFVDDDMGKLNYLEGSECSWQGPSVHRPSISASASYLTLLSLSTDTPTALGALNLVITAGQAGCLHSALVQLEYIENEVSGADGEGFCFNVSHRKKKNSRTAALGLLG